MGSAIKRHMVVFGDARDMRELPDNSVHLVVTSPPYFNAPFDYPGLFRDYDEYLDLIRSVAREIRRVLAPGRVACFIVQDVRIEGKLYPIVADLIKIFVDEGFTYRDRIIWRKPEGYIRISRRSGVLIQHPYPMYFYPDNVYEDIVIFQKGKYEYPESKDESSRIDVDEYLREKWYLSVWDITNVLPLRGRIEEGIAAFPEEIPYRLIKLFTYRGEVVLDPFLGSGTTLKVAIQLGRIGVGYEIDLELMEVIKRKVGVGMKRLTGEVIDVDVIVREEAKHLRTWLRERVEARLRNNRKNNH